MSYCSICNKYSECTHPVDFKADPSDPRCPEEIKSYLGLGDFLDDTQASQATEEFWENCAHLCHECMFKYRQWIVWHG